MNKYIAIYIVEISLFIVLFFAFLAFKPYNPTCIITIYYYYIIDFRLYIFILHIISCFCQIGRAHV